MGLIAGALVPLSLTLPDENGSMHVRATVLDATNAPILGSPFTLPFVSKGLYGLGTVIMPNTSYITVIYEVFTDVGFTTLSPVYGTVSDTFTLEIPASVTVSGNSQIISAAITQGNNTCYLQSKPLQIVQGASATFDVRFTSSFTGDPIDLTPATSINVQLLNTDGTLLTLGLTSGTAIVTPATIGKIQTLVTPQQSALLQYGIVPLAITMVLNGSTFIVQFPQGVNVSESVFS